MRGQRWERYLKFRCTGCGNCCRKTYICVTDADVERLMEGTGRSAEEIVRFAAHDEIHMNKRHPWWARFTTRPGIMVLRWTRGRCQFLDPRTNQCGVYAHRPIVCRLHPFNVTLSEGDTGKMEKLSIGHLTPCPHDWEGNETKRNLSLLERLLWRESNVYIEKVERWNRRREGRKTPREFLRELFGAKGLRPRRSTPASRRTAIAAPPGRRAAGGHAASAGG